MARASLEMFLKLIGVDKAGRQLNKFEKDIKGLDNSVNKSGKANAQFAAGMSGLSKTAIVGSSLLAVKALGDFSISAIQAASSAQEAAGAFGTTFGNASEKLNNQLKQNANLFGLTTSEAQQLISVFGSVAQGIGFTQEESADLSSQLFNLAGDIASFNNITSGSAPVLQAFRSALVGENEALKTYGIAISLAEVQTKAFEQTGKTSADALTRQEKALATTALIFEKSSVQQGNAAREASGFAAQMLIARSATTELQEEIGEELLPAAADLLGVFNSLRETATPDLITKFGNLGLTIQGTVEAFERGKDSFDGFMDFFRPDDYEEFNKELRETNRIYTDGILGLRGLGKERRADKEQTAELVKQLSNYAHNTEIVNKELRGYRQVTGILIPQNKKFAKSISKDILPVAEKLAKVLGLTNTEIKDLTNLQEDRDDAQTDLNRALEEEGLLTAQEALRKKELQQQIAELTFFQKQGKNVTEELAVAQEELRLVELALGRESDQLVDARKRAIDAQEALDDATNKGSSAMDIQLQAAQNLQEALDLFSTDDFQAQMLEAADVLNISWAEAINGALNKYREFLQQVEGKTLVQKVDEQLAEINLPGGFKPSPLANASVTNVPSLPTQDFTAAPSSVGGGKTGTIEVNLNLTDAIGEVIQRENIKIQERGNTFVLE
jgi:hypothetical protein